MSKLSTARMSEMLQTVLTLKFNKDIKKTFLSVSPTLENVLSFLLYFITSASRGIELSFYDPVRKKAPG